MTLTIAASLSRAWDAKTQKVRSLKVFGCGFPMPVPRIWTIRITRPQRRQLYRIRRRVTPLEGVALLFGIYEDANTAVRVVRIVEMENVAQSKATFAIDPEEQFRVISEAENQGLLLVGIYHSHPAPPKPSGWDLEYMAYNPVVWIIDGVSIIARRMRAYQLLEGKLHSVRIQTV